MNEYKCSNCRELSYSSADLEHLINKTCPECGGALVPAEEPGHSTKILCDNCVLLMESSFSVKKLRTESGFKCENCGRRAGIGAVCEITAKKGSVKT